MKILLDTNVILDIILNREPFVVQSEQLLHTAQQTNVQLFLTATTITDLYYIVRKAKGGKIAINFIEDLLKFMDVAPVNKDVINQALQSDISDFEDAIQECAAKNKAIDIIVTRNERDFKNSDLEIYTPEAFLRKL